MTVNRKTVNIEWEIKSIERDLGVRFPQSYRQFLLERGSATIANYQILGLPEKEERKEKEKKAEETLSLPEKLKRLKEKQEESRQSQGKERTKSRTVPEMSVLEATEILRQRRPDLPKTLVAIVFKKALTDGKDKAMCIDTAKTQGDDALLFEVSDVNQEGAKCFLAFNSFREYLEHLKKLEEEDRTFFAAHQRLNNRKDEVRERALRGFIDRVFGNKCPVCGKQERGNYLTCQQCFGQWQRSGQGTGLLDWLRQRLESKRINVPKFTHLGGKEVRRIRARAQDWHSRIFRVMDYAVGLTAFRHRYQLACLEVDEFWSADLYGFKKGQAIRNLTMAILSEANGLSGSLKIAFTGDIRENEETGALAERSWQKAIGTLPDELKEEARANYGRVHRPVPEELAKMAQGYGVNLANVEQGIISHQEGAELFIRAFEFPSGTLEKINQLEQAGYLTKEALCSVICAGIWSREQVIWFFNNASRPEAVILGTDLPESRMLHSDSLNYGRSVLIAERFQKVVLVKITDGFSSEERATPECLLEPRGGFWVLKSAKGFNLPWLMDKKEKVWVEPNEPVLLLSRPRIIGSKEENLRWIRENLAFLPTAKEKTGTKIGCLILNYEFISPDFGQSPEEVKEIAKEAAQKGVFILFPYERCDQLDLEVEGKMRRARKMRQFPARLAPLSLQIIRVPVSEWNKNKPFGHVVQNTYDYGRLVASRMDVSRYRNDFIITSGAVERMALANPQSKRESISRGEESLKILRALKSGSGVSYSFARPGEKDSQLELVVIPIPYERVETQLEKPKILGVRVKLPESFIAQIDSQIEDRIQSKSYVSREIELKSAHQQIREALVQGLPLAVSYLQPQVLVETVRDYIYQLIVVRSREETRYRKERRYAIEKQYRMERVDKSFWGRITSKLKGELPYDSVKIPYDESISYDESIPYQETVSYEEPLISPATLRIVYQDGTEGESFPLFSIRKDFQLKEGLYELPAQLVSLRHMLADYATEVSIIRNAEIQRKEDSAEQEDFAFRKVYSFCETFLKLIQGKISLDEAADNYGLIMKVLWQGSQLEKEVPKQGLKLHLFQSTGLEPAVAGAYRAVVALLEKYQGKLVVVPRIYRPNRRLQEEFGRVPMFDNKEKRRIVSEMYPSAIAWY